MCLAHLLRDATYAIDAGDEVFALGFRFLLLRAVAIGRRRDALASSHDATCPTPTTPASAHCDHRIMGPPWLQASM